MVDAETELVSDADDGVARVKTSRYGGEHVLLLRKNLSCPYRGHLHASIDGVHAAVPVEVVDGEADVDTGRGGGGSVSEQVTLSRLGTPLLRAHDASTFLRRLRGLHGVPPLGPDEALILRSCRAVQTFGMKAAIDVVFVDAEGTVLEIVTLAPGRTASRVGARSVVEMQAGTAETLQLAPGQKLVVSNGAWS